jgi:hypothetical protein
MGSRVDIDVEIDAETVGSLSFRETLERELTPGPHVVRASARFGTSDSVKVEARAGSCVEICIKPRYGIARMVFGGFRAPYVLQLIVTSAPLAAKGLSSE